MSFFRSLFNSIFRSEEMLNLPETLPVQENSLEQHIEQNDTAAEYSTASTHLEAQKVEVVEQGNYIEKQTEAKKDIPAGEAGEKEQLSPAPESNPEYKDNGSVSESALSSKKQEVSIGNSLNSPDTRMSREVNIDITDSGRTLIFSLKDEKQNTVSLSEEQKQNKEIHGENAVSASGVPQGLTVNFLQQLLSKHEAEKTQASQTEKNTQEKFLPFIYRLTCQRCHINGEIEIYTESYVCPECGGIMVLREMRIEQSFLTHPEIKNYLRNLWQKYIKDRTAKREWDLLSGSKDKNTLNLLAEVYSSNSISNTPTKKEDETRAEIKKPACAGPAQELMSFTISKLPIAIDRYEKNEIYSCLFCDTIFHYPKILSSQMYQCPSCKHYLTLPGKAETYNSSAEALRKDHNQDRIIVIDKQTQKVVCLRNICDVLSAQADRYTHNTNPADHFMKFIANSFDLYQTFIERFKFPQGYILSQSKHFVLLKNIFSCGFEFQECTGIKILKDAIVVNIGLKRKTVFFADFVIHCNGREIKAFPIKKFTLCIREATTTQKKIIGYTKQWLHTRADGGRDRRYTYNPEIKTPRAYQLTCEVMCLLTLCFDSVKLEAKRKGDVTQLKNIISEWNALSSS